MTIYLPDDADGFGRLKPEAINRIADDIRSRVAEWMSSGLIVYVGDQLNIDLKVAVVQATEEADQCFLVTTPE